MRVTYTVDKNKVLNEVGRLTAYIGSRKVGDETTYERISTTDSDKAMLEQFWKASCSAATDQLKHFADVVSNESDSDNPVYEVVMDMPSLYDITLNESIEDSLQNFFINLIVSKWCKIASPENEAGYGADALGYIADVDKKMYYRKRPTRGNN